MLTTRWCSNIRTKVPSHPEQTGEQYRCPVQAVRRVCEKGELRLEDELYYLYMEYEDKGLEWLASHDTS